MFEDDWVERLPDGRYECRNIWGRHSGAFRWKWLAYLNLIIF